MALRAAILRHVRVPLEATPKLQPWNTFFRSMSSHDDHITKKEVVKDFLKVDPSKVTPEVQFQKDLGLDSLNTPKEELEFPDKEAEKIDACQFTVEYINNDILVFEVL
ncbi:acyl carrier protein 1, mitochondrial-like [Vicia villosa]|uniref:acyl carrier protein 1, mitochondrial-like n=1 Tax=Vicia villosa TaxID=3911 RepID=UPI00273AB983|nr:acyl carrier protein 1, mitochondrial-like [Vicia villosa]